MKKLLLLPLFVYGCSSSDFVSGTVTAKNGHSIVSEYNTTSELECKNSGTRLDFFIDMDDSLSASPGDQFANSIVVCNGIDGAPGQNGADGKDGLNGEPGMQGPRGLQGVIGPQGIPGIAGTQGPVGPQGPKGDAGAPGTGATIKAYTSESCTLITGSSLYVKIKSNTASIYTSSSCSSSTKLEEINEGHSYFVASKMLLVYSEEVARVITFN